MERFRQYLSELVTACLRPFRGYLGRALILSFVVVAAVALLTSTLAISRTIHDYLKDAQGERVDRDMKLATAFYDIKLTDIAGIAQRLTLDDRVVSNLESASEGDLEAVSYTHLTLPTN